MFYLARKSRSLSITHKRCSKSSPSAPVKHVFFSVKKISVSKQVCSNLVHLLKNALLTPLLPLGTTLFLHSPFQNETPCKSCRYLLSLIPLFPFSLSSSGRHWLHHSVRTTVVKVADDFHISVSGPSHHLMLYIFGIFT